MNRNICIIVLAAVLWSCSPPVVEEVVEGEPIYFTYFKQGSAIKFNQMGSEEAFQKAEAAYRRGDFVQARKLFLMVAENSPQQEVRRNAYHDAGLCSMALEDFVTARQQLSSAVELGFGGDRAVSQAMLGQCQARGGDWNAAAASLAQALECAELPGMVRAETLVWAGRARLVDSAFQDAQARFDDAERLIMDLVPMKEQQGNELLAQAYFFHGEVYRTLCDRVKLKLPTERMERDFPMKRNLFRQAERLYTVSVRVRNREWSVRAGYSMGQMSEAFAADILAAEIPSDFEPELVQAYFEELKPYVKAIQAEARDYYRRTVELAERLGFDGPWVARARERLDALTRILPSH